MKYKVGETVRVRSWESMEKEFGVDGYGYIACKYGFTLDMRAYCGKLAVVTRVNQGYYLISIDEGAFNYTDCTLEPAFMVGDVVECLDAASTQSSIDVDTKYTVTKVVRGNGEDNDCVCLNGANRIFSVCRFKLIKREDKKYTGGPEFTKMMAVLGKEPTEKFYMIYKEGSHAPEVKHTSVSEVTIEAERLARKHPGSKIFILETVDCFLCSVSEPESVELEEL